MMTPRRVWDTFCGYRAWKAGTDLIIRSTNVTAYLAF